MKLCKSGGFRKMKARIKVFGRKLKRFKGKGPAALLIGGIALGMAGYFSAIFKKEKEEIDQIGGEDDEKDTSVSEEAPAKTEEPAPEAAPPAVAPEAAPSAAPPPAAAAPPAPPPAAAAPPAPPPEAAPPAAAAPPPAPPPAAAAPPRAAGTPVPAAPPAPPRAAGTPVPAAPPAAPPRAAGTPETSQSKAGTPTKEPGGVQGLIIKALISSGVTSQKAHANILATVKAESNFKVQSENLMYSPAAYIQKVFNKQRIPSLEFAETLVNKPEALANHVYKTTDGNSAEGDGFKYRGRGFIQHTGKNQYIALSKATGVDLVSNPDALNSPEVAAKAIPWFFLKYKNMKPDDMDDMSKVNTAVAFAGGVDKAAKREASAKEIYASLQSSSGTQLPVTGEMGQATSGTSLADAGQTQYDKDKNTKTNVVIVPKANNKTNNIEESRKAA